MDIQINLEDDGFALLKATDVAKKLNISRSLAYQLMQSGNIPTVRINRSIRVQPSDLAEYIRRQRTTG
jgi:excisionase family DNA binding protein